jgi:hypothetical protein
MQRLAVYAADALQELEAALLPQPRARSARRSPARLPAEPARKPAAKRRRPAAAAA